MDRPRLLKAERISVCDIVAPRGESYPKGIVMSRQPKNFLVVLWPSGLWARHHVSDLRKV